MILRLFTYARRWYPLLTLIVGVIIIGTLEPIPLQAHLAPDQVPPTIPNKPTRPDMDILRLTLDQPSEEAELSQPSDEEESEPSDEEESEVRPDHPDDAILFRQAQLQDEHGVIPPDGLVRAAQHIRLMQAAQGANSTQAAGIGPNTWTAIGPTNIGGRVRSIVIHPRIPTTMWLGSVSGGIWKTIDGGASWRPLDDFMTNLAVSTLAIDPTNPNTLYAGTGEGFYNADGLRGAGIFKTTDGGATWRQLSSTNTPSWYYVNRLAIDPNDGQHILAATRSGIWKSTNAGASWTQASTKEAFDVTFAPTDGTKAIASGRGTAWYSTNGGASWTPAGGISALNFSGRVEVSYAPSNPFIVYASIDRNSSEIWKSIDGGQAFTLVSTGTGHLGNQGWYANTIWVDPTNANILIVGGLDLWRSTDGGLTLTRISRWQSAPASAHADQHTIVAHPNFDGVTNKTVFFGNDGGIYKAQDAYTVAGTTGWQQLNNNIGITQFYGAGGNPTTGVIVGGAQDNGTLRYTGNPGTWSKMFGGDGGFSASDPTDPNYFYGEYVYAQVHRSTNGGAGSSFIFNGIGDAGCCSLFIAPLILDPNNPNTMLVGGRDLWRSINVKAPIPTWVGIKPPVTSARISAIAVARGNSDIIWVGDEGGNIYKTTNGTASAPTWVQVGTTAPALPKRYVTRLTIDSANANIVYVTFGGFSPDNVWGTTNGGLTWSDRTGTGATGLPDVPVRSLVINPLNSNFLYVGTEVGIFASQDGGATWSVSNDGPANVSVDELFWMNGTLEAATYGRGLFKNAPPVVQFGTLSYNVNEAIGTATVTVTLDGISRQAVSVSYATSDGTATAGSDYTATTGTLTFAPGETSKSFNIPILDDSLVEGDETVNLTLSSPISGASLGSPATAVLTITDVEPGQLQFSATSYSVNENGGTALITVTRSNGSTGTVSVSYATSDGTATAGSDYTATTGTLTFAPGETSKSFSIPILDDALVEGNETVNLTLSSPVGGASLGSPTTAVLTIVDVEPGQLQFSATSYSVNENGGSALITVTRSSGSTGTVSVSYATSSGTATAGSDYTATTGTLTFAPGETSKSFSIPILDDALVEGNETVNLTLSSPIGGATLGSPTTAVLTITDVEPGRLQFSATGYSVNEDSGTALITVTRSSGSTGTVSVSYATSNGTATAGSDYTTTTGTLTFAAGQTSKSFSIPILDDTLVEGNETVNLTLSSPIGGASLGSPATAVLTIVDVEPGQLQFSATGYSVNEDSGTALITVTRSNGSTGTVSVSYATSSGTATAGSDYITTTGTLTFAPGETSKSFSIPILDDTLVEGNETVNLTLSSPIGGASLGSPTTAVLTIVDVEPGQLQFSATGYSVNEDSGTALITVTRSNGSTGTVSVSYATSSGTATAGSDYITTTGTLTFAPGETSKSFSIPILDDTLVEGDEILYLSVSDPTIGASLGTPSIATLTITDDLDGRILYLPLMNR